MNRPRQNRNRTNPYLRRGEGRSRSGTAATAEISPRRRTMMKEITKKRQVAGKGSSNPQENLKDPKMDFERIMKDIEFLGSSHMTWKQKKDLENKKVVSLGGKPPKNQRLPLSVARVVMKKQKEREQKMLQENEILSRFKCYSSSSGPAKTTEKRRPEDRVLKATEGNFRNGVLDVKHLLKPSGSQSAESNKQGNGKGKQKNKTKGGKKGHGKRKGNGKKRH